MNEHVSPRPDEDVSSSAPESRCDNYTSYLDETYGYTYGARDIVSLEALEHHDALLAGSEAGLDGRDPDELDDFLRLGMARGWRRQEQIDRCVQVLEVVLNSDDNHPAVDYREVYLLASRTLADKGRYERALSVLERAIDWAERDARAFRQLKGLVLHRMGAEDQAGNVLDALSRDRPDDVDMHYEIAEDFAIVGDDEAARRWIDRTRDVADRHGDRAIEVDLDLLEARLGSQ